MRNISIYKAHTATKEVESATIQISERIPSIANGPHWRAKVEAQRDEQAQALCDVLWDVLPGGVLDAFLAEMMRRKASILRTAW